MTIRVYVVDDHPVIRETLADYLQLDPSCELCGTAGDAEEALAELPEVNPSVILLDVSLPGRNGLDLLEEIGGKWRCVMLSGHREQTYVDRAFSAGARGYVLKGRPSEILEAIHAAADGATFLSPSLRGTAHRSLSPGSAPATVRPL